MKAALPLLATLSLGLAHATTVGFTSGEGYSDGPLPSSADWTGGFNDFDVVDAAGSGQVVFSSADSGNLSSTVFTGGGIAGGLSSYEVSARFVFTRGIDVTGSDNQNVLRTGLTSQNNGATPNSVSAFATLQQRNFLTGGESTFRLNYFDGIDVNDFSSSANFVESAIGLGDFNVDDVSDTLELSLSAVQTAASTWDMTVSLFNVDTSSAVASTTVTGAGTDATWDAATKYLLLNSGNIDNLGASASVSIDSVTVIPEPSTLLLVGGALTALALFRRRR